MSKPESPKRPRRIHCFPIRHILRLRLLVRWLLVLAVGAALAWLCYIAKPMCNDRQFILSCSMTVFIYLIILWKSRVFQRTFNRERVGTVIGREARKHMRMPKGVA